MNAVEKLLNEGLERDPSDWSVRMELASKIASRGDAGEAAGILATAPLAPQTEEEMHQALTLAGDSAPAIRPLFESFVQENPSNGWAHHCLATFFAGDGEIDRARKHYETAVALNADFADPELEAYFVPDKPEPEPPAAEASEPESEVVPITAVSPLKPPEAVPATPAPVAEIIAEAAEPEPEPEPEAAAAAAAAEFEASEAKVLEGLSAEEFADDHESHDRALVVGEGEMVHAHDKEPDTGSKVSALATAILIHVGLIALLALIVVSMPRINPPQLVATGISTDPNDDIQQEKIERIQRRPSESAAAQMQVISTVSVSPVAMPDIQTENLTFDPIGVGDSFGMSMNFTDEDGAGMVSFFGSRSKAQKVVFVVDASASMNSKGSQGKAKFALMKEELIKSLEALPPTVEYQVIFFSGPAWYVEDGYSKEDWHEWVKNGKKLNFWEYGEGDPAELPKGDYIKATKSRVRKTKKQIEELKMTYGTDWRAPLEMAMNMKPDVIYFMTDGAVGKHPDKPEVVGHLTKYNKSMSNAQINTICLMVPRAIEDLKALADNTRGEFTLVLEDGTPVRGREVEKMAGKKKK